MRQDELETLYRSWTDDKLLDLHQKSDDYSETVQSALRTVMAERKLLAREKTSLLAANETGDYMAMDILGTRYRVARFLLYTFGLTAAVFETVFVMKGGAPKNWVVTVGIAMTIMLVAAIWLTVKERARFRFSREFNRNVFQLDQGSSSFVAHAPFTYFVYYTEMEHRYKMFKATVPVLCLGMTNEFNETVILQGSLTALDKAPPGWPHLSQVTLPDNPRFYTEVLFNRVNIQRLKTLFDEAHTSAS